MLIELLGQPASGKTFIMERIEFELNEKGYKIYSPERYYNNKKKISKILMLLVYTICNLKIFFDKDNKQVITLIRKSKRNFKNRLYYYKTFLQYLYLLKNASKKQKKGYNIIFSESIINLSVYIIRDISQVNKENLSIFIRIKEKYFTRLKYILIKIEVPTNLMIEKKIERLKKEMKNYEYENVVEDVKLNDLILNKLLNLDVFKDKYNIFVNNFKPINDKISNFVNYILTNI